MKKPVQYQGSNGEEYCFSPLEMSNRDALPCRPAVIVVADGDGTPVYVSASSNIKMHLMQTNIWHLAREKFGAQTVFVLTNGTSIWHENVASSLRRRHQPPMN